MSFPIGIVRRALDRAVGWWRAQSPEVPPELAACEYDCRARTCDAEKFDTCENRLTHAEAIRTAEAQARTEAQARAEAQARTEAPPPDPTATTATAASAAPPPTAAASQA
jgi:hypothetical protein